MRSCEYIQVLGPRRTKLFTLRNIKFFKKKRRLALEDTLLHKADCVSKTFEMQKKESKNDIVTNIERATLFYAGSEYGQV